ncbi:MAG: thioesterase family protein [Thermodesulfobacteriota bacterium]
MIKAHETWFSVRWADMDANGHMKNTAYLDYCHDSRMLYFKENGFPMEEFARRRIGPVVAVDELSYFRELRLYEDITVRLLCAGLSKDRAWFIFINEFVAPDGKTAARVKSRICWFDLAARKITPPPDALGDLVEKVARTGDFAIMENGRPKGGAA